MKTTTPWREKTIFMNRPHTVKRMERSQLEADVEAFLAKGGEIKEIPFGTLSAPNRFGV